MRDGKSNKERILARFCRAATALDRGGDTASICQSARSLDRSALGALPLVAVDSWR